MLNSAIAAILAATTLTTPVAGIRVDTATPERIVWTASGVYTDLVTSDGNEWRVLDEYAGAEFLVVFSTQGTPEVEDDVIIDILPPAWTF